MLPATRMTNRSPSPWSKTISAGTRESEQPRMMANGSCSAATSLRRAWLARTLPVQGFVRGDHQSVIVLMTVSVP